MKRTKARREHACIHCERRIDVGEEYMRGSLGPPDHPLNETYFTYKAHLRCDEFWRDEAKDLYEGEFWGDGPEFLGAMDEWEARLSPNRSDEP